MGSSMYNFGGYDPNAGYSYDMGMPQNPYGMWGGGFPQMQFQQQQPAAQEFDFNGMFDNLFAKYFPQQNTTQAPAAEAAAPVEAAKSPFSKNFGKGFMATGKFGAGGKKQFKKAGYTNQKDFLAKNPNFKTDYAANHPAMTPTPYVGPTPPAA